MKLSKMYQRFVDATARKPSGWIGQLFYRNPKPHYRSFQLVLEKLNLTAEDAFLDVCCGGGTLLQMALQTVSRASGLDYSPDMLALSRENNAAALAGGRLDLRQGDAESLPWDNGSFDAVANANALIFIPHPLEFFREIFRVLKPGGRFVLVTAAKRKFAPLLYGPWYPALKLYSNDELAGMLRSAGFTAVEVRIMDAENQIGSGIKGQAFDPPLPG
jgi:SAM-dependent methyltransferase